MSTEMSVKGLTASLNIARKLEPVVRNGEEVALGLPFGREVKVYAVDEYPKCPTNWMNGSHIASSYFFGVEKDKGMWINFNGCFSHEHDVAIVVSIQGINPITGQKMVGDNPLRLEKYIQKCPIHDVDFKQDRFCHECGYKWPAQNYIATTETPYGYLWIDGFRNADGSVRQYIFTEDELKGVAAQMIGKDRVFAIGVAFYLSKEKKVIKPDVTDDFEKNSFNFLNTKPLINNSFPVLHYNDWNALDMDSIDLGSLDLDCNCTDTISYRYMNNSSNFEQVVENAGFNDVDISDILSKKIEVGAGALIKQKIYTDDKDLGYWEEKPAGMIYMNYCDIETLNMILQSGKREENKEGFLKGLKSGI